MTAHTRAALALATTLSVLACAAPSALAISGTASSPWAAPYRPGEVVVRYAPGVERKERAAVQRATATGAADAFAPRSSVLKIEDGATVWSKVAQLRRRPEVASATPNWIARASFVPNDPGATGEPGGWQKLQWNFLPETGVDAPAAWDNLIAAGRPGGAGVTVAVLDTGVAYRNRGRFRRSPDLRRDRFRKGYDFVDNDPYPLDHNGHGTHVASTIGETADNGVGLTGLAYGARIMPVRVLNRLGEGDSVAISRGIRFAARRGAKIINLSFEFGSAVTANQIPDILNALRYARRRGVLVVGASGNASSSAIAYPARASQVMSVGATTEHGCQALYSNTGSGLDVVAPGGGPDAEIDDPGCREPAGRDIVQMTFVRSVRRFSLPNGFMGTSMAAPHVSATAALIVASGVIGRNPSPRALEDRLKKTATDLGRPGRDSRYGHGLINAARATAPPAPEPPPPPAP